jgi:hypothetical protein
MADYYTHFSVVYEIPEVHKDLVTRLLNGEEKPIENIVWPSANGDDDEDHTPQFGWKWDANAVHGGSDRKGENSIWLFSDEGEGSVDDVCAFIAYIQKRFELDQPFSIEWSNACSKLRLDAFGGGACIVYRGREYFINTGSWRDKTIKKLVKAQEKRDARQAVQLARLRAKETDPLRLLRRTLDVDHSGSPLRDVVFNHLPSLSEAD